jgi:D-beta-D-heptose 7-phosphate kinase/D-beta-D-heptose 1-phosphate adenosyltransferase
MGQVLELPQLLKEIASRRSMSPRRPPRVVFTNGCFDILHVGHVRYLKDARALGDLLVVGMNTDASVRTLKGPERPLNSENDRAEVLASMACVDYVVLFGDETPLSLIEQIGPDILVKGGDWPVEKIVGAKFVLAKGGEVKSLPFHQGHSTTGLIGKIQKL